MLLTHDYLHCKVEGCEMCNILERQKKLKELVKRVPKPTREQKTAAMQVILERRKDE